MKKFDRAIFILIGLGIWALAMTQVIKPSSVVAIDNSCTDSNPCVIRTKKMSPNIVKYYPDWPSYWPLWVAELDDFKQLEFMEQLESRAEKKAIKIFEEKIIQKLIKEKTIQELITKDSKLKVEQVKQLLE